MRSATCGGLRAGGRPTCFARVLLRRRSAVIGSVGTIAPNRTELSDDAIDELEDFLQSRCLPKGGMNISMLDASMLSEKNVCPLRL
jgi:hypothetical protein